MKKFKNFKVALKKLQDIKKYKQPFDNVALMGIVGLFGICFEQSWKAMKEILLIQEYMEVKTGSPKQILKVAFSAGLIKDEQAWLSALNTRSNLAHAQNSTIALEIIKLTQDVYYDMFCSLKTEIDRRVRLQRSTAAGRHS